MDKLKKRVEQEVKPRPRGGKAGFWIAFTVIVLVLALVLAAVFLSFALA